MSEEIVPFNRDDEADLFDLAAAVYNDMFDSGTRAPTLDEVVKELGERYPERYPASARQQFLHHLRKDEFSDMLRGARQTHIMNTLAPRLMAAQMGSKLSAKALETLAARLEGGGGTYTDESGQEVVVPAVSDKNLIEIAKLGMALAEKVDKDLDHATGGNQEAAGGLMQIFFGLPPEQAQAAFGELMRRAQAKKNGEVIEGRVIHE